MSNARKLGALFGASGSIDSALGGAPAGVVLPFAGSTAPAGWLLCYGQAVDRTTYAALYAAIGTAYGAGDGSTTFNLPDMRGRVPAGKDNMGGTAASRLTTAAGGVDGVTLGASGGGQTHTLTAPQVPNLNVGVSGDVTVNGSMPWITAGMNVAGGGTNLAYGSGGPTNLSSSGNNSMAGATTNGGGGAHPNVQPTLVLNSIIKT